MPNHVDQDLWITGPTETLKEFMEFAKDDKHLLSANKFIPYPEEYRLADEAACAWDKDNPGKWEGRPKDGFNAGGYEWCVKNWGTKWGIYDCNLTNSNLDSKEGRLRYRFNSAWSPPLPVITAMSRKFTTLNFKLKYYEQGMQFQGTYVAKNGQVLEDFSTSYKGHRGG